MGRWCARAAYERPLGACARRVGVGTAAIQIAKTLGARIAVTASAGKHEVCRMLGADLVIDYHTTTMWRR